MCNLHDYVFTVCPLQNCKLHVAKDHVCSQPAGCLALSTYLLSKWRSCPITPSRIATQPTQEANSLATTVPSPTSPKQGPGSVHPELEIPERKWICLAHHSQIFGFQPCHILKGWSWARDLPVLPPLPLPGVAGGEAASPSSWAEIFIYLVYTYGVSRAPNKGVNPKYSPKHTRTTQHLKEKNTDLLGMH